MKNKIITILILILCLFISISNMRLELENAKQKEYIKELENKLGEGKGHIIVYLNKVEHLKKNLKN